AVAEHIHRARCAGAREVMVNVTTHDGDLAQHRLSKRSRMRRRFACQNSQRRLQEMREVGNMRPRPADDLSAVLDQTVQFGSKRRNLRRETALEPARLALPNARERATHAIERLQPDTYLDENCGDQTHAENGE